MEIFKKTSLFTSLIISVSFLSGCAFNTKFEKNITLCRRYFLKEYASFPGNDSLYTDLPLNSKYDISGIYLKGMANENLSHVDFHYNGYFEFLLTDIYGDQAYYEQNSYTVMDAAVKMNFGGETKECKTVFKQNSNDELIITYLRVPYKIVINEVETDVFLWFFNGIFGDCPFGEGI